jgi:hypothetical protein
MDKSSRALAVVKKRKDARLSGAGLAKRQHQALFMLCEGGSVAETARWISVARGTIYNWIKRNPVFAAEYSRRQEELEESCRARLTAMTDKAATAIEKALAGGNVAASFELLKGMGLIKPAGKRVTDADEMKKRMELEARQRELDLERDERKMQVDHDFHRMMDEDTARMVADTDRQKLCRQPPTDMTKIIYQWKRPEPTPYGYPVPMDLTEVSETRIPAKPDKAIGN